MKRFGLAVFLVILISIALFLSGQKKQDNISVNDIFSVTPALTTTPVTAEERHSVFIPYWTVGTKPLQIEDANDLIYFGIAGAMEGIDKNDLGYKNLALFAHATQNYKSKLLTVRMIDSSINSKVLENPKAQEALIQESLQIAKEYDFQGIVFDFEIKALAFDSVIKNITSFYSRFYTATKKEKLKFYITLFGDTFYLARPYDVKTLSNQSDGVFIMAYDLHKARGNPGPNFPLNGKETYGYDFTTMVGDFSKLVPVEKLTIIFGLFGYDWTIDEKNQSIGTGEALSYAAINTSFFPTCHEKNCMVNRDKTTSETHITYVAVDKKKHSLWFEDLESLAAKTAFLKTKGILSTSMWAYSYY